jgi:hypothetical protein
MDVRTIDHVNLRIPTNGIENTVAFYGDRLDFGIERLDAYRDGNGSFLTSDSRRYTLSTSGRPRPSSPRPALTTTTSRW